MLLKGIAFFSAAVSLALLLGGAVLWWQAALVFLATDAALVLLSLLVLAALCLPIDPSVPQEHDSPFYRRVTRLYVEELLSLARVRIHAAGLENIPRQGRFLLVCNHLFFADPAILLRCLPDSQLAFITKRENERLPIVGKIMHKLLCQSINRENDREALRTIQNCIRLLREDEVSIAVFPEGYTSKDGTLHPFRPGVFKIAQRGKVPIAVCTVRGTRQILGNLRHLRRTDVELHLVAVIPPEDYAGMTAVQISSLVWEKMSADLAAPK